MISFTSNIYTVSKRKVTRRFYQKLRIKNADKVCFKNFNSLITLTKLNYYYEFNYLFYVWRYVR